MPEQKRDHFGRNLLIWALVLLILGAAGCFVLYRYLGVYEITRPDPVIEEYIQNTETEDLLQQAKENVRFELTEFEDPQELYASYLSAVDTTRSLTYRLSTKESTEDRLVYNVRSGPNLLCQVVLLPEGASPGFGRHSWLVSEVHAAPLTELLPSVTVTVDAVTGVDLNLNGKPLTADYAEKDPIPIPDLTKFESDLDPVPSLTRFVVSPVYGEVSLTDGWGNTISADTTEADAVHYVATAGTQSLRIRAPENLQVYVNGVKLTKKDVKSSSLGVLEGLEAYTLGEEEMTNTYQIDGLYTAPVVTAKEKDGSEVQPITAGENSFTFFHRNDPEVEEQRRMYAEQFFSAYMDYSAHAFDATRFWNLLNRTLPNSSLYNYIYKSQDAMYWASGTSTEYKDLRYENFHRISDYCFVCTVVYSADMTATSWYEQYSYSLENAYELAFITQSGFWYAAGMDVITDA